MKISAANAAHYTWGNHCDGWHLLATDSLSVIQEKMPPHTAEQRHYHRQCQQLFFVLAGEATFELEGEVMTLQPRESVHVAPGQAHCIRNLAQEPLEFLVVSEPKSHGDRISCQEPEQV